MKKAILSVVVAGTLLAGSPIAGNAQSNVETNSTMKVYENRYVASFSNVSIHNLNNYMKQYFQKYYQVKAPSQQQSTPVEDQSKQEDEQQQTVEQPKEQAIQQPVQQPTETTNTPTKQVTSSYALSQFEQQVISLTNNEREKYGLQPLKVDEKLSEVARTKSADMKEHGYFSHTSPTYGSPFDMMKKFGIQYRAAGENIAMGQSSPEAVVAAWMNSEGHRKNILSSNFTHIGVGHVEGNYWTQMFIGK